MTLLESIGEPGDLAPLSAPQQFDSPRDRILWDTGHQSCAHKLLTGRQDFSPCAPGAAACRATPAVRSPRTT